VHDILPMSLDTLKAMTWDLVCFAVPSSQIELVWKSVQARHRQFQLRQPLCEASQDWSWVRMLGSISSRPLALKLPIQRATVHWLLAWRPSALVAHRARLLTVVVTLACMRVNEVARLQGCYLWFDYLASYWVPGFEGTCSVHIYRQKNVGIGQGAGVRGGGDQRLHSPTAWLQPGYEPGAGGVALLPSSNKGALRALGI
jgi:hypothetical protein